MPGLRRGLGVVRDHIVRELVDLPVCGARSVLHVARSISRVFGNSALMSTSGSTSAATAIPRG